MFSVARCPERLEPLQMHVDGPVPEVVTPGHGHVGLAAARQQRTEHDDGRPDLGDELRRRFGRDFLGPFDEQRRRLEDIGDAAPAVVDLDAQAHGFEEIAHDGHVGDVGHVGQLGRAVGQDGRRHQLQHRVLGAPDTNGPCERVARPHDDAIHRLPVWPDDGDDPDHLVGRAGRHRPGPSRRPHAP
jgi:hypothetical protein